MTFRPWTFRLLDSLHRLPVFREEVAGVGVDFAAGGFEFREFGEAVGEDIRQLVAGVVVGDAVAKILDFAEPVDRIDKPAFFGAQRDIEQGAGFAPLHLVERSEDFSDEQIGHPGEATGERFDEDELLLGEVRLRIRDLFAGVRRKPEMVQGPAEFVDAFSEELRLCISGH